MRDVRLETAPHQASTKPSLVISLDFELIWGVRDIVSVGQCRERLDFTRKVIPRLLDLFAEYEIKATWATVGFLFYDDKEELLANLPAELPTYRNKQLCPYADLNQIGPNERQDPYRFGRSLLREILARPGQELGSHTFSHFYCLEEGQTEAQFAADLTAAVRAAALLGVELQSLVFPRNQVKFDYLNSCRRLGFTNYRGTQAGWMYAPANSRTNSALHRAARLADAYFPIAPSYRERRTGEPVDVFANRFLRPVSSRLRALEPVRSERIRREMLQAAVTGQTYHLWWHPENFGADVEANLAFLRGILDHHRRLHERYGMQSLSMGSACRDRQASAVAA